MAAKIDLKSELKPLYTASAKGAALVEVPSLSFLQIDGSGDPNTSTDYRDAIEALYATAYTLKFTLKKGGGPDYAVMPLEGLWWSEDQTDFSLGNKDAWQWTMMILQPDAVTAGLFDEAVQAVAKKKGLPALDRMRLRRHEEGLCAQILHQGPYSAEGPTIARLHAFILESGYRLRGKHHEIYLGDPRRSAPEKLKTIVRQPVAK
jgi:hypothetical protein